MLLVLVPPLGEVGGIYSSLTSACFYYTTTGICTPLATASTSLHTFFYPRYTTMHRVRCTLILARYSLQ